MAILDTALDPRAPSFLEMRSVALENLTRLEAAHACARDGGGEREVAQHHARGKLLPRERIELLVDRDSAVLEFAASAGDPPGAGIVSALGVIEQAVCMIVANDPTVALTDASARKAARAVGLAEAYRLPVVLLLDGGSASGPISVRMPDLALATIFSPLDGWTADLAALADHTIGVGVGGDLTAEDERDALRLLRANVRTLSRPGRQTRREVPKPPLFEADELLGTAHPHEILARILDGSEFEEFRPHRGAEVIAGFGSLHGMRTAILAGTGDPLSVEATQKGIELVRLAQAAAIPLLILANDGDAEPTPLTRALSGAGVPRIAIATGRRPARWAFSGNGFRFGWAEGEHDGVIDPRDTRTVLGICLGVLS